MRILFLSTWFPYPPDNGSKIRVYHLLRALGARHQVTLLSFALETANVVHADDLHRFCEHIRVVPCNPFMRGFWPNAMRFLSPAPVVCWPVPEMARALSAVLARTSFDVVIASTEVMASYALKLPQRTAKVLEEHNCLSRWMEERYRDQAPGLQRRRCWVSWQKTRYYEASLFRQFDLCTMVSERDREACLSIMPGHRGPIEVVPNGVDCQYNCGDSYERRPDALIFNGALTYQANYDAMRYFLAEVYPLIKCEAPEVSLTITGSTTGVDLSSLKLDESVHLSGYLEDVRPVVASASVCVVPIRQGGGTRLKILEAMALGTPVVATSKGAEGLEVTDGEHILIADDPADFADCTLRLLRDLVLRRRLAHNARRLVEERYDWGPIGQRFVCLVEEAVERHALQGNPRRR